MSPGTSTKNPWVSRKTFKIISAVAIFFTFFVNSYILLITPGPKTYEVSIYDVYPYILWINFIFVDALALFWILLNRSKNNHNALIFTVLFLNQLTVLLLPLFRGYFIYGRMDVLEHLGQVKNILFTGHIGKDNFYPIMHIFISSLNLIGGATLNRLTILLPAFFWIMLLLWYFMFVKNALNKGIAGLSIMGWMLFPLGYWHTSMVGNMFSYTILFLILGIWHSKIPKLKRYLLVFILSLNLVYFHPLTSIYLLIIFVLFEMLGKILGITWADNQKFSPYFGIIILMIWFTWYLSFPSIQRSFALFWISLVNLGKNPFLKMYLTNISRYNLSLYTLVRFALYRYFGVGVFSLAAIIVFIAMRNSSSSLSSRKSQLLRLYVFFIIFLVFGIWSVVNLFIHFVNFERSLRYILAFSLPLGSFFLFYIFQKKTPKILFLIVLLIMCYFAVFTVHMSPLSGNPNMQVSSSEYQGMGWWFSYRNYDLIGYDDGQITQYRFYEAWYGRGAALKSRNILFYGRGRSLIPEHFGYDKYEKAGDLFSEPHYFIIGRAIWEYYNATMVNKIKYWRWRPKEYERLKTDLSVNSVYSSVDIKIYFIVPDRSVKA